MSGARSTEGSGEWGEGQREKVSGVRGREKRGVSSASEESCWTMPEETSPCRAMPCQTVPESAREWHAVPCSAMQCYAML